MNQVHEHSLTLQHKKRSKKLLLSILLNVGITVAQFVGGIISGSLALLSDALHNFSDVISLLISYIADLYSRKEASVTKTFGYKRAEIFAAFINSATLIIVAVYLIYEAVVRFMKPLFIASDLVIWLAILGILFNGFSVLLLRKDSQTNMNMRSAYFHLLTDAAASVAVLIGGILMKYYQWFWVDSLLTLLIAVYLLVVGYVLLKNSFRVLMLFTPSELKLDEITKSVHRFPEIKNIHHIHIWEVNEEEIHLEAHMELKKNISIIEFNEVLEKVEKMMLKEFGINHLTIQPEFEKNDPKDIIVQD